MNTKIAFQDLYPDTHANCFGCGRNNKKGLQLKSYWDTDNEAVCYHKPASYYTGGVPENLYGGMIASLMDCHGAGTASAAKAKETGEDTTRFVTGTLSVKFLKPTPIDVELEIRAKVKEIKGRKVTVDLVVKAKDEYCAEGRGVFIQLP